MSPMLIVSHADWRRMVFGFAGAPRAVAPSAAVRVWRKWRLFMARSLGERDSDRGREIFAQDYRLVAKDFAGDEAGAGFELFSASQTTVFGCAEDIIEIDSEHPDIGYVQRFIGTQPPVA